MSRELNFDGYWEGNAEYYCDNPGCHSCEKFRFDSDEIDSKAHRADMRSRGWITTKVNGEWCDFCSEACRNSYIKKNT